MATFRHQISQFIEKQFPEHLREQIGVDITESNRETIVDFLEAYYEFIEENYSEHYLQNKLLLDYRDIDKTLDEFLIHFRNKYLANIRYHFKSDQRFTVKHIFDLYRAKGSPNAVKLLMRLLFNSDAEVYIPGQDVLRPSDSIWYEAKYVETLHNERNKDYINKKVYGSLSGASGYVESVVSRRVKGRILDFVYISSIEGTFIYGDRLSDVQLYDKDSPIVIGSLTSVTLNDNNVGGFEVGDIVEIDSATGFKGKAVVRSVYTETGAVEFQLLDGGFGYTTNSLTKQYISDFIVERDNLVEVWDVNDTITQKIETVYLNSLVTYVDSLSVGDTVIGKSSANTSIAQGVVIETGNTSISGSYTEYVKIQVSNNTFLNTKELTLSSNATFILNETIQEGSEITFTVANTSGSFDTGNNELVYWRDPFPDTGNAVSNTYSFGEVVTSNSSVITIRNAFGTFTANTTLTGDISGATATILTTNTTSTGASGTYIEAVDSNTIKVEISSSSFDANNKVYGTTSKVLQQVSNVVSVGAESIVVSGNNVTIQSSLTENNTFTGIVVGQDGTGIGIANTSNYPFIFQANTSILSNQNNVSLTVSEIAEGTGATVSIKSLTNLHYVNLSNEVINYENVYGVLIPDVYISGEGSGIGYVDSITVENGGSNYSNNISVTFSGGGYLGQDVIFTARGTAVVSGNTISSINLTDKGEGYFSDPTVTVTGGSGANLVPVMVYGYGFEQEILANAQTVINDVLTSSNVGIGTIASINYSEGTGYSRKPFVHFYNPSITSFGVQDQTLTVTTTVGSFTEGEIVQQGNTAGNTAIGSIKSKTGTTFEIRQLTMTGEGNVDDNRYFLTSAEGGTLIGQTTGAKGTITAVVYDTDADVAGDNADINPSLLTESGVIQDLDVVNSGYGYENGQQITITANNETITGTANVVNQGIEEGYWKTTTSHLNSEKKLHDNNYYQEFSYDIRSDISLDYYQNIIQNLLHMTGTKMFGSVVKKSEPSLSLSIETTITQANT